MRKARNAIVLVGLSGLLLTVAACGKQKAPAAGGTTTPPAPAARPADPNDPLFGPDGFRNLKLGGTAAELKAAGVPLESNGNNNPTCPDKVTVNLPHGVVVAQLSAAHGISVIAAQSDKSVHTPEGIKVGSSLAEVKKAYPDLKEINAGGPAVVTGGNVAAVPGNPKARYGFIMDTTGVFLMFLEFTDSDCH